MSDVRSITSSGIGWGMMAHPRIRQPLNIKLKNRRTVKDIDRYTQQHNGRQATSTHTTYQFSTNYYTEVDASINKYMRIKKYKQAHPEGVVTICYNVTNDYLGRGKFTTGFYSFFVLFCFPIVLQWDYFAILCLQS